MGDERQCEPSFGEGIAFGHHAILRTFPVREQHTEERPFPSLLQMQEFQTFSKSAMSPAIRVVASGKKIEAKIQREFDSNQDHWGGEGGGD